MNPRLAATRVLLDVAAGRRADSSLEARARGLSGPDRALCQEIAFGALRWKLLLDRRLDALLRKGLTSVPLSVQAVLEVAAYQLLFLDRVPAHAAINEAVEHVRQLLPPVQARGLTGVVNATLRALAGSPARPPEDARPAEVGILTGRSPSTGPSRAAPPETESLAEPAAEPTAADELAVAFSHPVWLVERWLGRFGPERTRALLAADNRRPPVHLRPHAGLLDAAELVARLRAEGAEADLHPLDPRCVVLGGGDPTALEAYRQGLFAVQDVSAQMVARLIPAAPQGLFVDLCAAPGGKIGAAAERPGGRTFLAADVSLPRLRRLAENARRQHLPLRAVAADARALALRRPAAFALADVPCLGTGTLRRRVDARWQKSPDRLPGLLALQREILSHAADLLAPGGRLLYATCSLEPEENEDMAAWLLEARPDLRPVDLAACVPEELSLPLAGRPERAFFVTPESGDCDGAFAVLLERAA